MTNLGKKDNRLQVLKYEFENLTKNGYTKEEYKDINIFTLDKDGVLILKVYRGTSTNPIHDSQMLGRLFYLRNIGTY